jgi:hypothetical protein
MIRGSGARSPLRAVAKGGPLIACVALAMLGFASSVQAAGEYDVEICTREGNEVQGNALGHGLEFLEDERAINFVTVPCEPIDFEPTMSISVVSGGLVAAFAEWTVKAPAGTLIRSVTGNRAASKVGDPNPSIKWSAAPAEAGAAAFELFSLASPSAGGRFTWTPASPTSAVHARAFCELAAGCRSEGEAEIAFTDVVARVLDQSAPTVTTGGSLLAAGPLRGSKELSFAAADVGSGVARVSLVVDGVPKESITDRNGGLCATGRFIVAMAPCKPELDSTFELDTRSLGDGTHRVEVVAEDASGQLTPSSAVIEVHNRPLSKGRPGLSGNAKVGETLAADKGQWDGGPMSFAYQWLRCPPGVKLDEAGSCTPLPEANGELYAAVPADAGTRLVAKVTATNASGSEAALSAPSDLVGGNGGGNAEGPRRHGTADPPQTKISRHPRLKTALRTARFAFASDQPGSSFQCKLDRGPFKNCHSPFRHRVKRGRHSFKVRARNAAGATDPSPATFRWKVL